MENKLDAHLNHRIAILSGLIKRQVYRIIADEGINITPEQWSVLSYLWDENGLTIGEIALRSRKDFANITRIVDKLQKQDYIYKKKNEKDGRSYLVYYTEKADNIKNRIEKCQNRSSDISLNGISTEEQRYIIDIIDRMEKNSLDFLNK
ncbi:MarR family transcriptional regulator [Bacteroidaceae bacterium HV4-6-C5C]|jgi:Transcriptional regulators|nr:MarR family transcriptional regulator [Bacteroidaceae bacterium HV4-6-C5C]